MDITYIRPSRFITAVMLGELNSSNLLVTGVVSQVIHNLCIHDMMGTTEYPGEMFGIAKVDIHAVVTHNSGWDTIIAAGEREILELGHSINSVTATHFDNFFKSGLMQIAADDFESYSIMFDAYLQHVCHLDYYKIHDCSIRSYYAQ